MTKSKREKNIFNYHHNTKINITLVLVEATDSVDGDNGVGSS
jgi:hypothetical protein